ncbi:MAG: hypothetical protein NZ601_00090, partial [candidate division WOR-3 bacterium]|nr:hypothetical protein [candidate division WOR-3 bacterium]MDW7988291.1 hypothetical protein [candidate division WOR-3 bacterium]
ESLKSDVSQRIKVNSDLVPWGLFYNLNYYNLIFNPKLQRVFENVENLNFLKVFWGIILLFAIITKFFRYYKIDLTMGFAIFTTGFGAMLATLIVSFVFQLHHGYLYYQVSILLTTFIIGSAIGAYISNFIQSTKIRNVLLNETIIITFFCFVLVTLLFFSNSKIFNNLLVFYIILLVGGFLMGAEFPLANKLDMRESSESNERVRKILGKLYAFDLLGGFLGALLGATALLPTIGVINTIIVVILLKVVSIFLILTKK